MTGCWRRGSNCNLKEEEEGKNWELRMGARSVAIKMSPLLVKMSQLHWANYGEWMTSLRLKRDETIVVFAGDGGSQIVIVGAFLTMSRLCVRSRRAAGFLPRIYRFSLTMMGCCQGEISLARLCRRASKGVVTGRLLDDGLWSYTAERI